MYISHLSGVKDVKNTVHVRICESLISDAVASPEVSPSVCASSCSEAVRICCLNVQPWPIVVIVMLAASNLALKYGWIHTKFTIWQTHSYQIPQAVPLCHRYPGISTIWCSTAKQYVFCAELQVSCLNQLLEPSTFGRWLRGPLRFGPIKLAICQGWNIARKHVALVPCLIGVWVVTCCLCSTQLWWYRPWDLSLGGALVVATPTCGCATMLGPYSWHRFVFVTFCWCTFLAGSPQPTVLVYNILITEVNSLESAKSPMNSTLQQPGPPVGLLRGHSFPRKMVQAKLHGGLVQIRISC